MRQGNGSRSVRAGLRTLIVSRRVLAASCATLLLGGASDSDQTYTFVLSNVYLASYADDAACPSLSQTATEIFLAGLPPAQRAELSDPAKERELGRVMRSKYTILGGPTGAKPGRNGAAPNYTAADIEALRAKFKIPAGKGKLSYLGLMFGYNMCTDPDDFPDFAVGNVPYRGRVAYGADLDGRNGRDDFIGPSGEHGVDNALIRAVGCNRTTRDYGEPKVADQVITSIASPPILQIGGVDDPLNDDDVTIRFFAAGSQLELDGQGKPLAWATYDIDPEPRFQVTAKGRIQNGVLTSEPFDLRIRMREQIIDGYREVKSARLRATIRAGEPVSGEIFGYHTIDSLFDQYAQAGTVGLNLMSCPAAVKAIRQYADGYPDPRTRRNTAISSALKFRGVPAFAPGAGVGSASAELATR